MRQTHKVMANIIANAEKQFEKMEQKFETDLNNKKDEWDVF